MMDHILYQIFKSFKYIKKHETFADNPLIQIYINKIEIRTKFKSIHAF